MMITCKKHAELTESLVVQDHGDRVGRATAQKICAIPLIAFLLFLSCAAYSQPILKNNQGSSSFKSSTVIFKLSLQDNLVGQISDDLPGAVAETNLAAVQDTYPGFIQISRSSLETGDQPNSVPMTVPPPPTPDGGVIHTTSKPKEIDAPSKTMPLPDGISPRRRPVTNPLPDGVLPQRPPIVTGELSTPSHWNQSATPSETILFPDRIPPRHKPGMTLDPPSPPVPTAVITPPSSTTPQRIVPSTQPWSLSEFVQKVYKNNKTIVRQRLDEFIADESIQSAQAIYDPTVSMEMGRDGSNKRNTAEEFYSRSSLPEYFSLNNKVKTETAQLLPTGARMGAAYDLSDITNNLQTGDQIGKEFESKLGFNLTQPLLKDAGPRVVNSNIEVANLERAIARQTLRQTALGVIFNALQTYRDLQQASQRIQLRQASLALAEKILQDIEQRMAQGQADEAELLEARSARHMRAAQVSEAGINLSNAIRAAQVVLSDTNSLEIYQGIESIEPLPPFKPIIKPLTESLELAKQNRPEQLTAQFQYQREALRMTYAKNQMLPQLDLSAQYALNGLGSSINTSLDDTWKDDHIDWSIGIKYVKALGNIKGKSDYMAAVHKVEQAQLDLQNAQITIHADVEEALKLLALSEEKIHAHKETMENLSKLVDLERQRLESGNSSARMVLERDSALLQAREVFLEYLADYHKAYHRLELAEGRLLLHYGLELQQEVNEL
ncbi:MAG: TolC family protein [Nitrospirae bacterium]|nr:TolC family protein [Magnetococcales bacterium]